VLFSGDLLFKGNIGRTDLPGSDPSAMAESLSRVTSSLPSNTRVYPGHGDETTIGAEIATLRGLRDLGVLPGLRLVEQLNS
jgi:glyoxylase-like metal-dependent hydrolase (beta-lactamase superfamily II)